MTRTLLIGFTPEEMAIRRHLHQLIEVERRSYIEKIAPYIDQLNKIPGSPRWVVDVDPNEDPSGQRREPMPPHPLDDEAPF